MLAPWLRTLDDAKADTANDMLRQVTNKLGLLQVTVHSPNQYCTQFNIESDVGELSFVSARVWCWGRRVDVEATGLFNGSVQSIAVRDAGGNESAVRFPIVIGDVVAKLRVWRSGLCSPYFSSRPAAFERDFAELMDLVAAAAHRDEPEWAWLHVECGALPGGAPVLVVLDDGVQDVVARRPNEDSRERNYIPSLQGAF